MKRSSQVALLLMGVTTAGASAYALMPPRGCVAAEKPAATAPGAINPQVLAPGANVAAQPAAAPCDSSRRSTWTRSSYWSNRSYSRSSSATQPRLTARTSLFSPSRSHTSVPSIGQSGSGGRAGFGSTGHSVSAHSSSS